MAKFTEEDVKQVLIRAFGITMASLVQHGGVSRTAVADFMVSTIASAAGKNEELIAAAVMYFHERSSEYAAEGEGKAVNRFSVPDDTVASTARHENFD